MSRNILVVGTNGHGSFQVRGHQLGAAIGARVTTKPTSTDWSWADVVVLIKHAALQFGEQANRARVPLIWDVLDFWQQPEENEASIADLVRQVHRVRDAVGIQTLIGATQQMAQDIGGVCLPHHSRPGLSPAPIRAESKVIGYEGQGKYLGPWLSILEKACAVLGAEFVVNPEDLRELDVVVSFRGGKWDGAICRQWKSGVKCVNALAAGRPVLSQPCAALEEIGVTGALVDDPATMPAQLQRLMNPEFRQAAYEHSVIHAAAFSLETIAGRYRSIIDTTVRAAA